MMEVPSLLPCVLLTLLASLHAFEFDLEKDPQDAIRQTDFIRDKEHLMDHMVDIDFDPEKATPEELDFHFFNLHDVNDDDQLDGLELLMALQHQTDHSRREEDGSKRNPSYGRMMLRHNIAIVDKILADDDTDKNGYINWQEFAQTRRASEILQQMKPKN